MSHSAPVAKKMTMAEEVEQYITDYGHTSNPEALIKLKEFADKGSKVAHKYLTTFYLWDK